MEDVLAHMAVSVVALDVCVDAWVLLEYVTCLVHGAVQCWFYAASAHYHPLSLSAPSRFLSVCYRGSNVPSCNSEVTGRDFLEVPYHSVRPN